MVVDPTRSLLGFVEFNRVYIAQLPSTVAADTTPTTPVGVFATVPSRGDIASHLVGVLGMPGNEGARRRPGGGGDGGGAGMGLGVGGGAKDEEGGLVRQ